MEFTIQGTNQAGVTEAAIARNRMIDWQRQRKMQSLDAPADSDQAHPLQVRDERQPSVLDVVLNSEQEAQV
jgi:hypothetical protein